MKIQAFSVWDEKAKAFLPPFFLPETGMAVRAFSDCVNDKAHAFGRNPLDYTLFCLGSFDDHSGVLEGGDVESVVHGGECIRRQSDEQQLPLLKGVQK